MKRIGSHCEIDVILEIAKKLLPEHNKIVVTRTRFGYTLYEDDDPILQLMELHQDGKISEEERDRRIECLLEQRGKQ